MLSKIFGRWANVASLSVMLTVAVVQVVKPDLLGSELAVSILTALGIHAGASDTPISSVKQ